MTTKKHIMVGMSGGVDSSVAALLLKEQGHHVAGLFMKNWEEDDSESFCAAAQDAADAQQVCDQLQIELHRVNFSEEYWQRVFTYFLEEYRAGRTPNPDILCNKEIKFKAFLEYAQQLGADAIATGHYAQSSYHENKFQLLRGLDSSKDQSYFLYTLGQEPLSQSIFPLGEFKKSQVRDIAEKAGFKNHAKKDSVGICFIGEKKLKEFLNRYLPAQPGVIETAEGKIIGQHDGLMFYTLGQRQGLKIGGLKSGIEAPWYVLAKDLQRNVLIVGQGTNHSLLFSNVIIADQLHWVRGAPPLLPCHLTAKTRYRQVDQSCMIRELNDYQMEIIFDEPQRAVTPGQSIVFYQGNVCLGGGVITNTCHSERSEESCNHWNCAGV